MDLFDLVAKISLDTSEYDSGLDSAREKFNVFGKDLNKAGAAISATGKSLTKGVTVPVVGLGTAIVKTGMDYEAGMSKVQAISGATGDEMDALGQKAMEMAAKTKFSTADSAEAYQYMAMAGWDASQMIDGLAGIMNLAAASGEDLGTTSDIVTDSLTAFGLQASDSGRFADVLAAASNSANTNVAMLGESFKYVAPVAGAMGYSVEDVSVALGLMANSGIKASQAGTSLRTAMTNMASPTSAMTEVMQEYGISLTDADGNMLSFAEIMEVLRERMGGLDEATQAAAASQLFGKEAMSGMLAIINAAPEDFDKLTEAINNSAGTTEEMAAIMQDNAAGAFDRLKSAVNVLFTELGEHLIPVFTSVVEAITDAVNWFGQLDEGTQNLILTIGGIAAVVGPVLIVIGKVVSAIGTIASGIGGIISAVKLVGGAISGLFAILAANPIGLVIAAIAALVAAFIGLWNNCEGFRNFWIGLWDGLKSVVTKAGSAIVDGMKKSWENTKNAWNSAKSFFGGLWDNIKTTASNAAKAIGDGLKKSWENTKNAWNAAKGFFSDIWNGLKTGASSAASEIGNGMKKSWENTKNAWNAAKGFFSGLWDNVKSGASKAGGAISDGMKKSWENTKNVWGAASGFFSEIVQKISGIFSGLVEKFRSIGGNIVNGLKNGISSAWDSFIGWITSKVGGLINAVKNMLGIHSPSTVFAGIGENMALGLAEGWGDQYDSIKRQIESGMSFSPVSVGITGAYSGARGGYNNQYMQQPVQNGGDTFIFNSPKALDPVSAAREMRKAKQQMALGYV